MKAAFCRRQGRGWPAALSHITASWLTGTGRPSTAPSLFSLGRPAALVAPGVASLRPPPRTSPRLTQRCSGLAPLAALAAERRSLGRAPDPVSPQPPDVPLSTSVDRAGRTPLHYAALDGDLNAVDAALRSGVPPDAADHEGWTALHCAAQAWAEVVCARLLEAGASVDSRDTSGNTPLWRAVFVSRGRGAVIQWLLRHGADPDASNGSGVSPRALAHSIANYDVAQYFPSSS